MENGKMYTEQADRQINRGCPMCGGAMTFDPADGKLYCPYCEHRMEVEEEGSVSEQVFHAAQHVENFVWGAEQKQIICQSCGAQAVYDALLTSAVCPFCGSNQVMEEAVDTSLPPNGLCPFEVTQQQAGAHFKAWMKRRLFAPSKAKKSVKPEMFTGMYIPYWTFDAHTASSYTARYGKDRTYTDKEGRTHTKTDWYSTSGDLNLFIDDELTYGTTRHDVKTLRQIEPYDTQRCVPYRPEYLSGYLSERYSIGLQDAWGAAKQRMDQRIEAEIEQIVTKQYHADHFSLSTRNTMYNDLTYKYVLVPLWQSSFDYQSKRYQFMVNGQTGKVGGKSPVSALRVAVAVLLALVILGLAVWLFSSDDIEFTFSPDEFYFYAGEVCPDRALSAILSEAPADGCSPAYGAQIMLCAP